MPQPLDYATPLRSEKKPNRFLDGAITLSALEILLAVLLNVSADRVGPLRDAAWYASIAIHWPEIMFCINGVASILICIAVYDRQRLRPRVLIVALLLFLISGAGILPSIYVVNQFPVTLAIGPATIPVNDPTYRFDRDYPGKAQFTATFAILIVAIFSVCLAWTFRRNPQRNHR